MWQSQKIFQKKKVSFSGPSKGIPPNPKRKPDHGKKNQRIEKRVAHTILQDSRTHKKKAIVRLYPPSVEVEEGTFRRVTFIILVLPYDPILRTSLCVVAYFVFFFFFFWISGGTKYVMRSVIRGEVTSSGLTFEFAGQTPVNSRGQNEVEMSQKRGYGLYIMEGSVWSVSQHREGCPY